MLQHILNSITITNYKENRDLIDQTNQRLIPYIYAFCALNALFSILLQQVLYRTETFMLMIAILVCIVLLFLFHLQYYRNTSQYATIRLYAMLIPIYFISANAAAGSTNLQPFMIFLVVLPLMILDRPLHVILYTTAWSVLFLALDSVRKPELFYSDTVHLLESYVMSVTLTLFLLSIRISNFQHSQQLESSSEHDTLTGILNRGGGDRLLHSYIENGIQGSYLILDVDHFKHINDTYGHAVGDEILKQVAQVLASCFRATDIVMRMGGDEFIAYAVNVQDKYFVQERMRQINSAMRKICINEEANDYVTVSIGCVINDGSYPSVEALQSEADRQLYITKENGKDSFHLQALSFDDIYIAET